MADIQQQEYISNQQKAKAQEEAIRTVHQSNADKAMDVSPSSYTGVTFMHY